MNNFFLKIDVQVEATKHKNHNNFLKRDNNNKYISCCGDSLNNLSDR